MFYSLDANWWKLTHPVIASMLPLPQRYYVPGRLRDSYRPRLEAAGLWNTPGVIEGEDQRLPKDTKKTDVDEKGKYSRAFEREKVSSLQFNKYTSVVLTIQIGVRESPITV